MNEQSDKQVVVFQVGDDKFALDILSIRDIARFQTVRKIPRAPEFLSGVIDLRGTEIVPIIDLHDRLDLKPTVKEDKSRIIVAPVDRQIVGFRVDVVRDVMNIDADALESPPAVGAAPDFLEAVIRNGQEIILLLDLSRILTSEEKLHMAELRDRLRQQQKEKPAAKKSTKKTDKKSTSKKSPGTPKKTGKPS